MARYVEPVGTHVPEARQGRTLIGVSVGADSAPHAVDVSLALDPGEEIAALSLMRASVQGYSGKPTSRGLSDALQIATRLAKARYAVLVHDAEPTAQARNPLRPEALLALAQALNEPTRAALISLRAGGNRVGAESVLTWQSGFPLSVDYSRGYPRYEPARRAMERLSTGGFKAALIVGSASFDEAQTESLGRMRTILIGPRATQTHFPATVAIDTGIAGIHEGGTAYRTDEVPLRLRPPVPDLRSAVEVLGALLTAVRAGMGSTSS
jgi:formylmethanofuran dehydrogenase subunit B